MKIGSTVSGSHSLSAIDRISKNAFDATAVVGRTVFIRNINSGARTVASLRKKACRREQTVVTTLKSPTELL